MFDIGFWELVLIGVVALLVVGPERLPALARQAGEWVGKAKRFVSNVQADIEREFEADELKRMLNDQQHEISQLKGMISDTQAEVHAELHGAEDTLKSMQSLAHEDKRSGSASPAPAADKRGVQTGPPQPDQATLENGAERR
ncbi:MAG: twin-arginine translocase subunit TatB [Gammaproteobacteria bacterium]|nr:twin-arginine translocase subunit TatB [Gammaproteobacteria bacterium]